MNTLELFLCDREGGGPVAQEGHQDRKKTHPPYTVGKHKRNDTQHNQYATFSIG